MAFPNVPNVPGVPSLPRSPGATFAALELLARDALSAALSFGVPRWGIFRNGVPVVIADTVASVDFKRDWVVADYPVEGGKFESYDKVETPFATRVRYAAGGSEQFRRAFLASVAAIAGTLDAYDVVTPEETFQNVNVNHYDYRRTSTNGAGMVTVDVWLVQMRLDAVAEFTSTKTPSGASSLNGGVVQATPAPPSVTGPVDTTPDDCGY